MTKVGGAFAAGGAADAADAAAGAAPQQKPKASLREAFDVLRAQRRADYTGAPPATLARACAVLATALHQRRELVYAPARAKDMVALVATALRAHLEDARLAGQACRALMLLQGRDTDPSSALHGASAAAERDDDTDAVTAVRAVASALAMHCITDVHVALQASGALTAWCGGDLFGAERAGAAAACDAARIAGAPAAMMAAVCVHKHVPQTEVLGRFSLSLLDKLVFSVEEDRQEPGGPPIAALLTICIDMLTHHAACASVARGALQDLSNYICKASPACLSVVAPRAATAVTYALRLHAADVETAHLAAWALHTLLGAEKDALGDDSATAAHAAVHVGAADLLAAAVLQAPSPADVLHPLPRDTALSYFNNCAATLRVLLLSAPRALLPATAARAATAATRAIARALATWSLIVNNNASRGADTEVSFDACWITRPVLLLAALLLDRGGAAVYAAALDAARACGAAKMLGQTEARLHTLLQQRHPHPAGDDTDSTELDVSDEIQLAMQELWILQAAFLRRCARCGAKTGAAGAALKRCAACRGLAYCSPRCQAADWARHKPECAAAQQQHQAGRTTPER